MVAKISTGGNMFGALAYNQNKVDSGEAKVLFSNRMLLSEDGNFSIGECMRSFEMQMPVQLSTKKPILHISINPHPEDVLTDQQLSDIAKEYMRKLGYGDQPYLVYKHTDIGRHHIHIVGLRVDENGKPLNDKFEHRRSKQITRELEQKYKRARDDSRELTLMLEKKNQDLLEKQDTEVYLATLKERNRIAREIHDNVGHMLSRSILMVGALKTVNQAENLKVPMEQLDQTLNEAMTNVRQSVHDLHDESVNLKEVMESLAEEFRFCPVQLTYDMGYDIPKEIKYSFIAITKEALNNVMRHSNANEVKILAREHPGLYQLIIEDNGTSDERIQSDGDGEEYTEQESAGKTGNVRKTENTESSGIGIENMKKRVRMLGGTMQIQKENGFRIFITVPKNEGKR